MLQYAVRSSGITGIAVTKLDILGGMDQILVAVRYPKQDGIPCLHYDRIQAQLKSMNGWPAFSEEDYRRELASGVSHVKHKGLRAYLELIQEETEVPISHVCFGQDSNAFLAYV